MSPREIELDEALEKYKKAEAEKPREPKAEEQKEFEAARKEKKLKKPGSVSRFFNQFGIGKYWEQMNDYFEQEEQMERGAAEKEAAKETVGDVQAAAEERVQEVKTAGEKMPTKILESAARAGAGTEEAAPVVAEAKVEEAAIEKKAEAAKADLDEEVKVFVAEPEVKTPAVEQTSPYEFPPDSEFKMGDKVQVVRSSGELEPGWKLISYSKDYDRAVVGKTGKDGKFKTKRIELDVLKDWQKLKVEEAEREDVEIVEKESTEDEIRRKYENAPLREIDIKIKNIDSDIEREVDPDLKEMLEAEKNILAKMKKEKTPAKAPEKKIEAQDLPAWDEAEELKKVKILAPEDLPPVEEFEAAEKEQREREVPVVDKVKTTEVLEEEVVETPSEWEDIEPFASEEVEKQVLAGRWEPKISAVFHKHQPEIFDAMEEAFFAKGEKGSKAQLEHMLNSLEKVGQAYVKQKAAKEMSPQDEKALRKWIAETKGAIEVLRREPEEIKPVEVMKLKKKKRAA